MSEENEIDKHLISDHSYDGIMELDNPLPDWWQITFYASIIFGIMYMFYFHLGGPGQNQAEELAAKMAVYEKAAQKEAQKVPQVDDVNFSELIASADAMADGKAKYLQQCASCHGKAGEGQIGPNLTDAYWLHGKGDGLSIAKVVSDGVLEKGMPPWAQVLGPKSVMNVTAFVLSLKGTQPTNAKAPQGEKY